MGSKFYPLPIFTSTISDPKIETRTIRTVPLFVSEASPNPSSEPSSEPGAARKKPNTFKGSAQLNRWSRARALRSGRRLELHKEERVRSPPPPSPALLLPPSLSEDDEEAVEDDGGESTTAAAEGGGKAIYMVSDGTGWTAEHSVNAALGQFEHCLVDRGCPVNTHLFSGTIRMARAKSLGFSSEMRSNYSEMDHVREELEFAGRIFAQNPLWPVIEVTGKAIEETAAIVVRIYHDQKQKCSMPRISKRY